MFGERYNNGYTKMYKIYHYLSDKNFIIRTVSLRIFMVWRQYEDTYQARKVAAYILANATCLNVGIFSSRRRETTLSKKKKKM